MAEALRQEDVIRPSNFEDSKGEKILMRLVYDLASKIGIRSTI